MLNNINKKTISGFGVFADPPIWIGNIQELSCNFEEIKDESCLLNDFIKVELYHKYKGRVLVVESDGHFVIQEKNIKRAKKLLNEILSIFLYNNIKIYSIKEIELSIAEIPREKRKIFDYSSVGEKQIEFKNRRDQPIYNFFVHDPPVLTLYEIEKMVKKAEKIILNEDWSRLLRKLLKSYTNLLNLDDEESFNQSWKIIEKCINLLYDKYKSINNPKKCKVFKKIDILYEKNIITDKECSNLHKLRKFRNIDTHENKPTSRNIVEESYFASKSLLEQTIRHFLGIALLY